jgi:hypothetical protein
MVYCFSPEINNQQENSRNAYNYFCYAYIMWKEKLIRDQFNLEALAVNQVKVSKLWQTGKMFSLEPKREVANRCHMRAFRCHLCLHFVDNMCCHFQLSNICITKRFWLAGDDDYLRGATSINHQVALRANFKMGGSRIHFEIRAQCHLVVDRSCTP